MDNITITITISDANTIYCLKEYLKTGTPIEETVIDSLTAFFSEYGDPHNKLFIDPRFCKHEWGEDINSSPFVRVCKKCKFQQSIT
jgi:hypothetical protein